MLTKLTQYAEWLTKSVDAIQEEVGPLMQGTEGEKLDTQLQFFFLLKQIKDAGEEMQKFYNACEPDLAKRINTMITAAGLDEVVKTFNGVRIKITPDTKYFVNCNKDKKPAVLEWLKNHPIGRELVKEDVHAKTLEKFVKDQIMAAGEQGLEVPDIPPGVSLYQTETITTRKQPNK